jgi:hypothetical protein
MRPTPRTAEALAFALRERIAREGAWFMDACGRSMEPVLPDGSVLRVDGLPDQINVGDLLVFALTCRLGVCCHAVIANRPDGAVLTAGANNKAADGWIAPEHYIGVVRQYRIGGAWFSVAGRAPSAYRLARHRMTRRLLRWSDLQSV